MLEQMLGPFEWALTVKFLALRIALDYKYCICSPIVNPVENECQIFIFLNEKDQILDTTNEL